MASKTIAASAITLAEWLAKGTELFGEDKMKWRFVCPVCKHVASTEDWKNAGAPESAVGFSCVGRWIPGSQDTFTQTGSGPCNYAGGGLFRLNPVKVDDFTVFAFAE